MLDKIDPHSYVEAEDTDGPPSPLISRPAVDDAAEHSITSSIDSFARRRTGRRNSSVSHVDIDYFDPHGVAQLRRSLVGQDRDQSVHATPDDTPGSIPGSDDTIFGPEGDASNFDFEKRLRSALRRADEQGIQQRELGVAFKNLRVIGRGATAAYQETIASQFDPRLIPEKVHNILNPPVRDILSGFEGAVRPGEMLLVLGIPGSGCTSFLKTLANQRHEFYSIEGEVFYDGFTPKEIMKHYRGDTIYVAEDDVHFPTLKVDETLRFAAKMRTPQNRVDNVSRNQYVTRTTEVLETIFGLRHTKNTKVGDAAIRGVSGGEKKRVSISEALALRACVGAWDNSTRGLDASTALEYVRALRIATDVSRLTTIVSIYQAGESLYQHFDKVCLIYEGRMAYFGRADKARQYFIDLGFEPAHRQTTADFLVSVTDPQGRIVRDGAKGRTPTNAAEFSEAFSTSDLGKENRADVEAYRTAFVQPPERKTQYRFSAVAERAKTQKKSSPYTISLFMQARAVALRRIQIIQGNLAMQAVTLITFILQAIIIGTIFYNVSDSTQNYFSRGGVLFFALLFSALSAMSEVAALFAERPIILKQYQAAMYHPFIDSLALTLVDIPIMALTLMIFGCILYFMVGLQTSASQFFIFYLFVFIASFAMKTWFRAIAAAFKNPAPAQTVTGIILLLLVLYTGYTIPKPSLPGALRWLTWINPLRYGFESLMTNEFRTVDGTCSSLAPSGPGYENATLVNQVCTTVGSVAGRARVEGSRYLSVSFGYTYDNMWRNFGVDVAFAIGLLAAYLIFTEMNTVAATEFSVMLFKRGRKSAEVLKGAKAEATPRPDAEKGAESPSMVRPSEDRTTLMAVEKMNDIFTWRHLEYEVPIGGGETRKLLDDVNGYVASGMLTALMGESGAGKTTLLNVLAQRQSTGVVRGERLVDGRPLPPDFQAQTGYCQQMDTHLAELTVRESLLFSAKLRQPADVPLAEKEAYVETVLKMCGLANFADAIVGSLGAEHRKRTTIGVELAAKPKLLLFLDEPTSGLDSQSAWAIVSFLRKLADHGQAILCTIHQPSSELFQVFDRLLLLRKGGQTVYFGDIGPNATTLLNYFQANGGYPCPSDANPAEYILDVIGAGATATTAVDWHDAWKKSPEAQATDAELARILEAGRQRQAADSTQHTEFSTGWAYQVRTLLEREFIRHFRDPSYIFAKMALNIAGALLIGLTFLNANETIQGTQNKVFAVFMSTILSAPLSQQILVPFINTRGVYEVRERPSRMYSWTALLSAQLLGELPFNIIGSSIYFLVWYWLVGLPSSRAGYTYLMLGVVHPLYYTTLAQGVAATSPNIDIAAMLFSFVFTFVIIFDGVMQIYKNLGWWKWMYRVSPHTYLVEGLVGQAVARQSVTCSAQEIVQLDPPSGQTCGQYMAQYIARKGGYLLNSDATSGCDFCSVSETDQFLYDSFNMQWSHRWRNFGMLWIYIAFNIFAMFVFTWIFRQGGLSTLKNRIVRRRT